VAKAKGLLTDEEKTRLRDSCTSFVSGHGMRTPADLIKELEDLKPDELTLDTYGEGGVVAALEQEVRSILDKPIAVFMPSGTMIQQIALRIHADRRNRRTVAFHPTCHMQIHEDEAYQRLHGLIGRTVGNPRELITIEDLQQIHEPIATLLLELPQREIGGQLPKWKQLVAQVDWAHANGAAAHMDGARLWECGPFYDRPLKDVAALFDTVYVSFYKGLGGTGGGMLLGEEDVIAEAREWRHRHGGTIFYMWPYAASALAGLRLRLPRIPQYVQRAKELAAALSGIDGVEVTPDPPQTPMMHISLRTTRTAFDAGVRRLATEQSLWTFGRAMPSDIPGYLRVELYAGDATLALDPAVVATAVQALLPKAG